MPWQTPKTNWTNRDVVLPDDMNRVEGNIAELKKAATIDIQDAGGYFDATNVEDALQELGQDVINGKTAIANSLTAMNQPAQPSETFASLAAKIRDISKDADAGTGDVLSGKTFYQGGAKKTGTMPNRGAVVITPGTSNITIPAGYHNGSGYVVGDANLVASNIRYGKSIFGVAGTLKPVPVNSRLFGNVTFVKGYWTLSSIDFSVSLDSLRFNSGSVGFSGPQEFAVVTDSPIDLTGVKWAFFELTYHFTGTAYLIVSTSKTSDYTVYNARTQLSEVAGTILDLTSLSPGSYYVRVHWVVSSGSTGSLRLVCGRLWLLCAQ